MHNQYMNAAQGVQNTKHKTQNQRQRQTIYEKTEQNSREEKTMKTGAKALPPRGAAERRRESRTHFFI